MALRVLLADESSTIKKVFQLALQDYGVEVRPVNIGLDVVPIAKNFNPDIIFADVLLQKKSGYEVSSDVKSDPGLGNIPVVLMWSGFMELDEDKFQASLANGKLEKPFDVTTLRKLVSELVPKTKSQRLSQYLSFPSLPEMEEVAPPSAATAPAPTPKPAPEEEFQQVPIPKMKSGGVDRFRIPVSSDLDPEIPVSLKLPSDPIDVDSIFRDTEPEEFTVRESKAAQKTPRPAPIPQKNVPPTAAAPVASVPQLTEAQIENIVRAQTKEAIEAAVWKVLPELAQQIIEREIQKLLKEKDGSLHR